MFSVTVQDNWWLIYIKDGPRSGDILSLGWWLPPAVGQITQEQFNNNLPIDCGENIVAKKISTEEALKVIQAMQERALSGNMIYSEQKLQ
jgi:hypothetical protein